MINGLLVAVVVLGIMAIVVARSRMAAEHRREGEEIMRDYLAKLAEGLAQDERPPRDPAEAGDHADDGDLRHAHPIGMDPLSHVERHGRRTNG